ncbi:unnamed protein product [Ceratitis capitata]|uniref:(Mediterranean fruit fly) hypothetical protein n=1 Tax=Ceratitis capitata TaxID=7213 RepID=A0A811U0V3_CERCA|nr:unnamed protein product [Ceratitis capitata]
MLATLVIVPDSPDQGVLYLLRLLLAAVTKFPFDVIAQDRQPLVSNDELYGHDPKFIAEVNNICVQVIDEILLQLKILGSEHQQRTQAA